jgi:hypothetical protein
MTSITGYITEIFGDFLENLSIGQEYLIIHFSPSSVPLKQKWRNNGLSADFLADYLATFLTASPEESENFTHSQDTRDAVNYIANELLENAMKYNNQDSGYPIILQLHLHENQIVFCLTNSVIPQQISDFQEYIEKVLTSDTEELYQIQVQQLRRNRQQEPKKSGGLGYLTMINDYMVKLGWKFEPGKENPEVITVTTMVQLPL